jgi:intracellular septation protein A
MGLTKSRFKCRFFDHDYIVEVEVKNDDWVYTVLRGQEHVHQHIRTPNYSEFYHPHSFSVELDSRCLIFTVGYYGMIASGLQVTWDGEMLFQSSDKPFKIPRRTQAFMNWLQKHEDAEAKAKATPKTPEQLYKEKQAKQLRPAIAVDFAFGLIFFFVAREFGLVTAAVVGAAATFILLIVDRFVKPDLTGGFAVFGAVMALISATAAILFQDDLAVKLRGSIIGLIVCFLALIDAARGGQYLGKRFARYFYVFGILNPRKASLAVAASTTLIILIDTPLAFILTTDQWIWYNSFFDTLISLPIVFGAMWLAKERPSKPG